MKKNKTKSKRMSNKTKKILAFSLFGVLALGSASSTLLFMNQAESNSSNKNNKEDSGTTTDDPTKNKLFENLTAADMNINGLKINVSGLMSAAESEIKDNIELSFTGGVNYLSFMQEETLALKIDKNNGKLNESGSYEDDRYSEDVSVKFGGQVNLNWTDENLKEKTSDTTRLNETMKVYSPGDNNVYLDFGDVSGGYKISGKFITSTLTVIESFLTKDQKEDLNDFLDQIQQLDVATLLPMIGTIGGSLVSDKKENYNDTENICYSITIPGSLIDESITDNLTVRLISNNDGELVGLALDGFNFKVGEKEVTVSMSTDSIQMFGIDSKLGENETYKEYEGYKEGLGENILETYYSNTLDTTPNIVNTVSEIMDSKTVALDYSLNFNEYAYTDNTLGEENENASHTIGGLLAGQFDDDFKSGNYRFSINKDENNFNNSLDIKYQDYATSDDMAKGLFFSLNNNKGYLADSSIDDLFETADDLIDSFKTESGDSSDADASDGQVAKAMSGANEILNNSTIQDIINGNWYKYKSVIKSLSNKETGDSENGYTTTFSLKISLRGLNLHIPFEFEDVDLSLNINYDSNRVDNSDPNSDYDLEVNYINYIEIANIPLRKVTRGENSYLDTAGLKLELKEDSVNKDSTTDYIQPVQTADLSEYVNYKAAIGLFDSLATVVEDKKFAAKYSLNYQFSDNPIVKNDVVKINGNAINFEGEIAADLSDADFKNLDDEQYGKYKFTARTAINDIQHNFQLNYLPSSESNTQNLFFDYYSWNEGYGTRLSLKNETMKDLFGAVSTVISSQTGSNESSEDTTDKVIGKVTDTIDEFTDYVDGDVWNYLKKEIPSDIVTIENGENKSLIISVNVANINSDFEGCNVSLTLDPDTKDAADLSVTAQLPNDGDYVTFNYTFVDYADSEDPTGFRKNLTEKNFKASDSSVEAITNIVTNQYWNSFIK